MFTKSFRTIAILRAGMVIVLIALLSSMSGAPSAQAAAQHNTIANLPLDMQARISAVLGRDEDAYAVTATANGYRIENPANQLAAEFDATGVRVNRASDRWGFALRSFGYGDSSQGVCVCATNDLLAVDNAITIRI